MGFFALYEETMDYNLFDTWNSMVELHKRFDVELTPERAERYVNEETFEAIEASIVLRTIDRVGLTEYKINLRDEIADSIYVLLGLAYANELNFNDIQLALQKVIIKNDNKSWETHSVVDGKITKRSKISS